MLPTLKLNDAGRAIRARLQRNLVVAFSSLFVLLALFFAYEAQSGQGPGVGFWKWFCLSAAGVYALNVLIATHLAKVRVASGVFCAIFFGGIFAAGVTGGLVSMVGPWTVAVVVLTAFLLGPRWGTAAGMALAAEIVSLFLLHRTGIGSARMMETTDLRAETVTALTVLLIILVVTVLYERSHTASRTQLMVALADREADHLALENAHAELKALHQRALAQEKLSSLGLLAAGVAHEINNPMSFVASNVSALLQDLPALARDAELLREYREEVLPETLDGIRRVNAIVADLRRFARGEPESLVEYTVDDQVRTAARIVHTKYGGSATLELALHAPRVALGRPGQIVQVVVNLLVNARQALSGAGKVTVETEECADGVLLRVRDSGTGMSQETQRNLFQPFFTTKPVGEGTGLGLAVVHGIVQAHGGSIEVESALGVGTLFTVRLPLLPPPAALAAA